MLLEARNIDRFFLLGSRKITALEPVSISVSAGDFLVITGPSGSGKSTLLNILSGLDSPSSGDIFFKGRSISQLNMQQRAFLRNESFGFIFQTPHLLADKTVLENTLLPFSYGTPTAMDNAKARCMDLLDYAGMAHLADRYPNTLSGGEMQRVVFARALCREPEVIFADEPTGSLDGNNSRKILDMLQDQAAGGRSVIMVTHDPEARLYATSAISLNKFTAASGENGASHVPETAWT